MTRYLLVNMQVVLSTRQCILLTGRCLVSVRFYLVYRVGLVDKIFGHVDLVNKALGLVNKPKWHFEMACILLMIDASSDSANMVAPRESCLARLPLSKPDAYRVPKHHNAPHRLEIYLTLLKGRQKNFLEKQNTLPIYPSTQFPVALSLPHHQLPPFHYGTEQRIFPACSGGRVGRAYERQPTQLV